MVAGIRTNLPFHLALMDHPDFVAGAYDTGFIGRNRDALLTSGRAGDAHDALVLGAAIAQAFKEDEAARRAAPLPAAGPKRRRHEPLAPRGHVEAVIARAARP